MNQQELGPIYFHCAPLEQCKYIIPDCTHALNARAHFLPALVFIDYAWVFLPLSFERAFV